MITKLYSILNDDNLTQSQVAQAALEIVKASSSELSELCKLSEVCRDSEATCKYPNVLRAVKYFIGTGISYLCSEIQLSAFVDQ